MTATEEVFDSNVNLSPRKEKIIQRILDLSEEQFDRLITLYSQQETESDRADQSQHRTSA